MFWIRNSKQILRICILCKFPCWNVRYMYFHEWTNSSTQNQNMSHNSSIFFVLFEKKMRVRQHRFIHFTIWYEFINESCFCHPVLHWELSGWDIPFFFIWATGFTWDVLKEVNKVLTHPAVWVTGDRCARLLCSLGTF